MSDRKILRPEQLDDLGRTVLKLAQELWVVRDRQRVLEQVLAEKGIDVADIVENYTPSGEFAEKLKAERKAFINGVFAELMPDAYR
jgi:hypothetical protein